MEGGNLQHHEIRIQGKNFCGSVQMGQDKLTLDITQFKKGYVFSLQISNQTLKSQPKRFLFFKNTDDMLDQLLTNEGMEISDENNLRIPIEVTYRNKPFELTLEIPLQPSNLSSEEKYKKVLEELEKMNTKLQQYKMYTHSYILHQIRFQGDLANQNFSKFKVDGKKVEMIGVDQHTTFNHNQILPKSGRYYFQFRVIKTVMKAIFFGVCAESIKSAINSHTHQLFMGYYLAGGQLCARGQSNEAVLNPLLIVGQSVIKVDIDMDKKQLFWIMDNKLMHAAQFSKELEEAELYPFVNLYSQGDILEILSV